MPPARPQGRAAGLDRMLTPLHRWIWRDSKRRVEKLLRFGETETDGGRDILRAAESTSDPLLRRLYLGHASDQHRHGGRFGGAGLSRFGKGYLGLATAIAGVIGGLLLTIQYFVFLPPFAWVAKRAARQEARGWTTISRTLGDSLTRQY